MFLSLKLPSDESLGLSDALHFSTLADFIGVD